MNPLLFLESISDEVWHIDTTATELLENLTALDPIGIRLNSFGIVSHQTSSSLEVLEIEDSIVLPELGISLRLETPVEIYMYADQDSHLDICVEITFPNLPEALNIYFNLRNADQRVIKKLTSSVSRISPFHSHKSITDKYSPSCQCCAAKQLDLRRDPTKHALHKILYSLEAGCLLRLTHSGSVTHSFQEFTLTNLTSHDGVVWLHAEAGDYSIDLTQVYSIYTQIELIKETPHSTLIGFNSHGILIFRISKEGIYPYQQWTTELELSSSQMKAQ